MGKKKEEPETALAAQTVPKHLVTVAEGELAAGMENVRPQDILIPRLILMQALSPVVVEDKFEAGDIVNSVSQALWLEKGATANFIPVFHYLEWIEWGEREKGESWLSRSLDHNGKLAQMSARAEKRVDAQGRDVFISTEYHNFVALFPEISKEVLVVISCAKTNHKKGRQLIALARYRGRYPLFAGKYVLHAEIETNRQSQKYFVYNFDNAGWASEPEFAICGKLYGGIKDAFDQRRLIADQLHEESTAEEETEM